MSDLRLREVVAAFRAAEALDCEMRLPYRGVRWYDAWLSRRCVCGAARVAHPGLWCPGTWQTMGRRFRSQILVGLLREDA